MPKLATTLSKLEEVAEPLREFYEPVDANDESAGFQLQTDGSSERTALTNFRDNNIALRKQVEGLDARLGKLDGIESRLQGLDKLVAAAKSAEDQKSIESGDIDGLVSRRVAEVVTSHESKFAALENVHRDLTTERDGLRQRVGRGQVRDSFMLALDETKVRIRPGAVEDVLRRTHETWTVKQVEGRDTMVALRGGEVVYGEDGQPQTMKEYVGKLATDAPYFFESGQGAGSPGNRGKRAAGATGKQPVDMNSPLEIGRNLKLLIAQKAELVGGDG